MCAIDYCDGRMEMYSRKRQRAAKEHVCDECGRIISRGETYDCASGLYEGHWDTYRSCGHCAVAVDWLIANCGGVVHGGVREDIEEHVEEYQSLRMPLSRLVVGMRRKWRRVRDAGLMPTPPIPRSIKEAIGA